MVEGACEVRVVAVLSILTGLFTIYFNITDRNLECLAYGYYYEPDNSAHLQCRHLSQSIEVVYILTIMNCLSLFSSILLVIPTSDSIVQNVKNRCFLLPYILWHITWFIVTTKDKVIIDRIYNFAASSVEEPTTVYNSTISFDMIKAFLFITTTILVGYYHNFLTKNAETRYCGDADENRNLVLYEDV